MSQYNRTIAELAARTTRSRSCWMRRLIALSTAFHKYGHVFSLLGGQSRRRPGEMDFVEQGMQIASGESPLERLGNLLVVTLKIQETFFQCLERTEVVGCESLTLEDGEIDLDLVQPTGVHRPMDKNQVGITLLQAGNGAWAAMSRPVIDDPKDSPRLRIRRLAHHLGYEPIKRRYATFSLAAAKELGTMDIQRRMIGPGPAAGVFVFHLYGRVRLSRTGRMSSPAGLDAGFLIGRQHELVVFERLPVPHSFIKIQDASRFQGKVGIPREYPRAVSPRADGILVEPSPHGAVADCGHEATLTSLSSQIGDAPAGQGYLTGRRHLACQGLDLNDEFWGENTGGGPALDALQAQRYVVRRTAFATC